MHLKKQAHLQILKEIAELLNEETELLPMVEGVLKKLLKATGFTTGWVFLLQENGGHYLAAAENLPPALSMNQCQSLKKGNCWCVDRLKDNRLKKATNIIECRRIEKVLKKNSGEANGIIYHATIPLQSGNELFGLLNVAAPFKEKFTDDELAFLESIALQIGSAIKRIRLTKREQEIALVEERNRLARDLHDAVNQLLFSLTLTARGGYEMSPDPIVKKTFNSIQEMAQDALTEMRALIWQLRPHGLEKGLIEAIKGYGEMLGLRVHVSLQGVISLPSLVEETLWRISQEALNNCKKHAGVSEIFLELQVFKHQVAFTIRDHGIGFFYDDSKKLPTVGVESMKERTEAMNGTFMLKSKPKEGTVIHVILPY
ncbi:GAF domain-containing sensor histidine kinase [Bacillus chungangensis]|uniref:GAF domain-containing sensor histidine kinase n=1 Tax=Bacillus chungangensis TaxID=587633 RepID=UPI00352006C5